jgi:hypothetical protein
MTLLEYEQQAIPVQQWCAILRAFDADTLYAVSGATLAELQLLVAQGWLRTIEGTPTRYELLPAERQAMLTAPYGKSARATRSPCTLARSIITPNGSGS